jgi:hypothetical protein
MGRILGDLAGMIIYYPLIMLAVALRPLDAHCIQRRRCPVVFELDARFVHSDRRCHRLSFEDGNEDSAGHYLILDRMEGSLQEFLPEMDNVYLERDDQQWGGFGGIEGVALQRNSLILHLNQRMATHMGGYDTIRVGFALSDTEFCELQHVLGLIMQGYESRLHGG